MSAVGWDDITGQSRSFLRSDYAVECEGDEYDALRDLATGYVFLWPVGVPVLFMVLLVASRKQTSTEALSRAMGFLHDEYRLFYWE